VRARVAVLSERPILMVVDAKKTHDGEPFTTPPQQSDYVQAWKNSSAPVPVGNGAAKAFVRRIFKALPTEWQQNIKGRREKSLYSLRNGSFYRKLL